MRKYNINANLVRVIKHLYDKAITTVQLNGSIGEWFRKKVGVRQLCRLSPTLFNIFGGWSGGAMVLGKLPVPGRPTSLEKSRARAFCTCRRCGWGCLDIFTLIYLSPFLSPSLWETTRYRLKYCLKGSLSPKTTNQPKSTFFLEKIISVTVEDFLSAVPPNYDSIFFHI